MNIRKIFASLAASAVAVSAMAAAASAEVVIRSGPVEDQYYGSSSLITWYDVIKEGDVASEDDYVYVEITPLDPDTDTSDWYMEFIVADNDGNTYIVDGTPGFIVGTAEISYMLNESGIALEDLYGFEIFLYGPEDDEEYWLTFAICYDDEAGTETTGGAGDTNGAGSDPDKGNADTGAEGVAVVAGLAVVAAGAIVVARKRK